MSHPHRVCALLALAVVLAAGEALLPCDRPLRRCDAGEGWFSYDRGVVLAAGEDGVRMRWTPAKAKDKANLQELGFGQGGIGRPRCVRAVVELVAGDAAFTPILSIKGAWHVPKPRQLAPGLNTLVWNLPDDLVNAPAAGEAAPYFLQQMQFQSQDGAPVEAVLRSLRADIDLPVARALDATTETGDALRIIAPGAAGMAGLRVASVATAPLQVEARCRLHDFAGRTVQVDGRLDIAAGGSAVLPFAHDDLARGVWWVDYELRAGAGAPATGRTSFCVMDPVGSTPLARDPSARPRIGDEFLFGIMSHSQNKGPRARALEIRATAICGAKVMRTDIGWISIQRDAADAWDWSQPDAVIDGYLAAGVEVEYMLGFTPRWAAPPAAQASKKGVDWMRSTPDPQAYGRYVEAAARRYGDRVRLWEVWNEPDLDFYRGTADQYLELLEIASGRIRAAAPGSLVMNGGFGTLGYHPTAKPGFQAEVMRRGQRHLDIHAIHEHGSFLEFERLLDGPHAEIRRSLDPPKPLFCNETSLAALDGEALQAEALWKKQVYMRSRGAIGHVWYDLRDDGPDPRQVEHNYGLLTLDFEPKAAYVAYNTLVRTLRGKRFVRRIDADEGMYAFLFADASQSVLVVWYEGDPRDVRAMGWRGVPADAIERDIMGNERPVPAVDGRILATADRTPRALVFAGTAPDLACDGELLAIAEVAAEREGGLVRLGVRVANPGATPLRTALRLRPEQGWQATEATAAAEAGPGGSAAAVLRLSPPAGLDPAQVAVVAPAVVYQAGPWSGELRAPQTLILRPGDRRFDPAVADAVLETHAAVVNFQERDPTMVAGLWRGPQDHSARILLSRDGTALTVRVEVTDDVHCQTHAGATAWQGDSVQFGFVVPRQLGYWELSLARGADGSPDVFVSSAPNGAADARSAVRLSTAPRDGGMVYEAVLPYAAFGLSDRLLENGIRFGLIVNDDDGGGRKGWIQTSRGIGEMKDPGRFPYVQVRAMR